MKRAKVKMKVNHKIIYNLKIILIVKNKKVKIKHLKQIIQMLKLKIQILFKSKSKIQHLKQK